MPELTPKPLPPSNQPGHIVSLRRDVARFAVFMSHAMDSKHVERETRDEPHYMTPDYPLIDALDRLQDKTEQLVYDATARPDDRDRVLKTAVHLANFAMIIATKLGAV